MNDHTPNEPEPAWPWLLIVPRPVYATALISEGRRRTRALHAEMVANGTAEYAIPVPRHGEHRTLTVRKLSYLRPACESGQHAQHPGYTCEEVEQTTEATGRYIAQAIARMTTLTAMADVPEALRGPRWPGP